MLWVLKRAAHGGDLNVCFGCSKEQSHMNATHTGMYRTGTHTPQKHKTTKKQQQLLV